MLDLEQADEPRYEALFRKRQATHVRAARRKGMALVEAGAEGLSHFLEVFEDTYARHGVSATHSPQDIAWLLDRLPHRARLYLAMLDGRCAAGVLVFMLTKSVAYTFYICNSTALAEERGMPFLYAELADLLARRGVRWLDLGPACWDGNFNAGVTFFKESLGCVTHCRDRWSWRRSWTGAPALASRNFIMESAS
nr:GNAT family N-acetyltransferase [Fundidesulfovibrio agrisoli]